MRISLQGVSHDYEVTETSAAVHVLDDITLDIASGDFAVLMGVSGSGKSTLLNLIGAVDRPTSGKVFLGDMETSAASERDLTMLRRTTIGFVFQFFNLIPTLDVFENVGFPLSLMRRPRKVIEEQVHDALEEVHLSHRARHFPNELSGGEMQRAAIARAVIHRPQLLLADEPTGNLDSKTGETILDVIQSVHRWHQPTVVLATHSERAAARGDYIIRIGDGRISR